MSTQHENFPQITEQLEGKLIVSRKERIDQIFE